MMPTLYFFMGICRGQWQPLRRPLSKRKNRVTVAYLCRQPHDIFVRTRVVPLVESPGTDNLLVHPRNLRLNRRRTVCQPPPVLIVLSHAKEPARSDMKEKRSTRPTPEKERVKRRGADLRNALLSLHKALVDSERVSYEQAIGAIQSPNHFLQLLTRDPWFAWLHPLSQLIVAM